MKKRDEKRWRKVERCVAANREKNRNLKAKNKFRGDETPRLFPVSLHRRGGRPSPSPARRAAIVPQTISSPRRASLPPLFPDSIDTRHPSKEEARIATGQKKKKANKKQEQGEWNGFAGEGNGWRVGGGRGGAGGGVFEVSARAACSVQERGGEARTRQVEHVGSREDEHDRHSYARVLQIGHFARLG